MPLRVAWDGVSGSAGLTSHPHRTSGATLPQAHSCGCWQDSPRFGSWDRGPPFVAGGRLEVAVGCSPVGLPSMATRFIKGSGMGRLLAR